MRVACRVFALVGGIALLGTEEYAHLCPSEGLRAITPVGLPPLAFALAIGCYFASGWDRAGVGVRARCARGLLLAAFAFFLSVPLLPTYLGERVVVGVVLSLVAVALFVLARSARGGLGLRPWRTFFFLTHAALTVLAIVGWIALILVRGDPFGLVVVSLGVLLSLAIDLRLLGTTKTPVGWLVSGLFLWFGLCAAVVVFQAEEEASVPGRGGITIGPYLRNLGREGVTICWETEADREGIAEVDGRSLSSPAGTRHALLVDGLASDRSYDYLVSAGEDERRGSFRTAPVGPTPFEFTVLGDSGEAFGWGRYLLGNGAREVARSIERHSPESRFLVHCGDLTFLGNERDRWRREFFAPFAALLDEQPLWVAPGNHEMDGVNHREFFPLPSNAGYGSFDHGSVHFILLAVEGYAAGNTFGPSVPTPIEPGSAQYEWLSDDLAASRDRDWTLVFFHHPALSSGLDGSYQPALEHLVPLFEQQGVDVVFAGHDHGYEYSVKDGVVHVVTGGGGSWLNPVRARAESNPYSQYYRATWHHCRVRVDGTTLRVEAIDVEGRRFHGFRVDKAERSRRIQEL